MTAGGLAGVVDAALTAPALVLGTRAHPARRLDVVVADVDAAAVSAALAGAGFVAKGPTWARFADGHADVVEVLAASRLPVPAKELAAAAGDGDPLEGTEWLRVPDLDLDLLLLACFPDAGRRLSRQAERAWLHDALAADAGAWSRAVELAETWGVRREVDAIQAAVDRSEAGASSSALRPVVVALSGLDGSGKSTQAHALAATVHDLGGDAVVQWARVSIDPRLRSLARPVTVLTRVLRSRRADSSGPAPTPQGDGLPPADAAARSLRERSALVHHVWVTLVVLLDLLTQRQLRRAARPGVVVIRDRAALDTAVHLHETYTRRHSVRFQRWLLRRFSLTPDASFLLDLDGAEAFRRKPEEWSASALQRHAELYRREAAAFGVTVVDATLPRDAIAATVARQVWALLP